MRKGGIMWITVYGHSENIFLGPLGPLVGLKLIFFSQYSDIFKEPFLLRVKYSNAYFYIAQNASDPPLVLNVW